MDPNGWCDWKNFKASQKEIELPAGEVAHVPVTIRYIDESPQDVSVTSTVPSGLAAKPSTSGRATRTVLLLHGIPTWSYLYHAVIPAVVDAGYRVLAPDFLGYGFSDRRDRFDRSFQDQARMIIAFMKALHVDSADVVGHDIGGAVALILAIEHSYLVKRLMIANSVCYDRFDDDMLDFGHPIRWKPRPVSDLVTALEDSLDAGISNKSRLTREFREGIIAPWANDEGKLSLLRNASALNPNQTMALVDRHGSISAKTLILWGMNDPWQMPADGQRLASEIPAARFQPIYGASHWVQQDSPEQFVAAILSFLLAS